MSSSQTPTTSSTRGAGGAIFAGTLMIIGGFFWSLEGPAGVNNHSFYKPVNHQAP